MKRKHFDYRNIPNVDCPSCGSIAIVKTEQKEPCEHPELCTPRGCELTNCQRSIHYVSSKQYSQGYECLNCGYKWREIRRIF